MFQFNTKNFAETRLVRDADRKAATFVVESAAGFPSAPFLVSINEEIIEVGARSGTSCTSLLRGREGTDDVTHESGAAVEVRWTAGMYEVLDPYHAGTSAPSDTTRLWIDTN